MYVWFIQSISNVNTLCKQLRIFITLGPYFLYKNLFIRSFIYSEVNPFGLLKFSQMRFEHLILSSLSLSKKWFI